jgi:hypothetical protein
MPSATNLTENSGLILWQPSSSAQKYQLRYRRTEVDSVWTQLNIAEGKLMDTLKGLTPATQYAVQVRSVCDTVSQQTSNWSVSKIFTTPVNGEYSGDGFVIDNNSVVIYPNPASNVIRIEASFGLPGNVDISVIDVTGRELNNIIYNSPDGNMAKEMDVSSLANGLYFIRLVKDGQTVIKRIVKEQ